MFIMGCLPPNFQLVIPRIRWPIHRFGRIGRPNWCGFRTGETAAGALVCFVMTSGPGTWVISHVPIVHITQPLGIWSIMATIR